MTKLETVQCNICEAVRVRYAGQWYGVYFAETQEAMLHSCGGCMYIMERLLIGLGFLVETPCTTPCSRKAIERIVISWILIEDEDPPNEFRKELLRAMSEVYKEMKSEHGEADENILVG